MDEILQQVKYETERQQRKWGQQDHKPFHWMTILMEEVGETAEASLEMQFDPTWRKKYRKELIQVAAVAVSALDCFDRLSE